MHKYRWSVLFIIPGNVLYEHFKKRAKNIVFKGSISIYQERSEIILNGYNKAVPLSVGNYTTPSVTRWTHPDINLKYWLTSILAGSIVINTNISTTGVKELHNLLIDCSVLDCYIDGKI